MSMESHVGVILTGETEELEEKPVPVPLCSLYIPHGPTLAQSLASTVRGQQLTACAIAWPVISLNQR
jgi:hypothetical protein